MCANYKMLPMSTTIFRPVHKMLVLLTSVSSKGSGESAQSCQSLGCSQKQSVDVDDTPCHLDMNYTTYTTRKGSDQTAHMRRLIWDFAGRTYHIVGNLMLRLKCSLQMTLQNIFSLSAITSGFRQIRILYFTALCAYIQQRNLQNTCQK